MWAVAATYLRHVVNLTEDATEQVAPFPNRLEPRCTNAV
jgi:hypothetical protein